MRFLKDFNHPKNIRFKSFEKALTIADQRDLKTVVETGVARGKIKFFFICFYMPRSQRNDNFIDKTFTVLADILLKVLPTTRNEKEAFVYYRDGMSAQAEGEYAEALQNYAQAMRLEVDPYDRSFIFYNIGLLDDIEVFLKSKFDQDEEDEDENRN